MSGGSYDYAYRKVNHFVEELRERIERERRAGVEGAHDLRERFAVHLEKVAKAIHDIEWVDSCDYGPGDEVAAILAVLGAEKKTE